MSTWLVPKKAAIYIKERNPETMIGERTIRTLVKNGFPCIKIESRTLVNVETFDDDLDEFSKNLSLKAFTEAENNTYQGIRRIAI